jgi:hypothetical protein
MSYAAHHKDFGSFVPHLAPPDSTAVAKVTLVRRIFDAFLHFRQRDLDRQIDRFVAARSGGIFTDNLEREISQRLLTSDWSVNGRATNDRRFR